MELKKIKIESFKDAKCQQAVAGGSIVAFINPTSYVKTINVAYEQPNTIGDPQTTQVFSKYGDQTLKLGKIIVDGTGLVNNNATVDNKDVEGYVQKFQDVTTKYIGETHAPPYLKVSWGNLSFICVCDQFTVTYTLFKPDGTALRAEIELSLKNTIDWDSKIKKAANQSPDLTHMRTVKAGDTLPLMTYQIYGSSSYYMEVARINRLSHINDIKPGDQLYFPPLKK
jgi:hypothetical protein